MYKDIVLHRDTCNKKNIRISQFLTLFIGIGAIVLATNMRNVLEMMLYSYSFMVSGLLIPVLGILVYKKPSAKAAIFSMIFGGLTTLLLIMSSVKLPLGLDPNFFGISFSLFTFIILQHTDTSWRISTS